VPRDPKYDVLFEPVAIGPKRMKNRFYQTPHCTSFGSDRPGTQAHFRATKAEGGWGAVCIEYCSVHPEANGLPQVEARLWDEDDVRNLALTCELVHAHGALAGVELWYAGAHANTLESRAVPRGPSQLASDLDLRTVPRAMSKEDIREVQGFFVEAAKRARSAGFDIVYLYGAHSQGPMQFLSPFYNKRTDEYGGSFENRARFWLETLERMKEAVGDDCAVVTRISSDALGPAGVGAEEACRFVELADHLVDLWDVTVGSLAEWGEDLGPSRFYKENWQASYTAELRRHTRKPVVGVGRFTSPDTMVEAIRSGQLDLIGAARPSISDPFLPKKIEEGRADEIRECIGCNVCVARWEIGGAPIVCTQNATAGEEYRRGWHPERFERAANADSDVLVVGAGPAGLECALVLARRGMRRVHLVEADPEVGGALRWVARLPGLAEWARVVSYREAQLARLANAEVILGTRLGADEVREYGADIVVVATGARWAENGLNGVTHEPIPGVDAALAHCATPEQVMAGKETGGRVLVYDCEGYFTGVGLAEKLAREGKAVRYATPHGHLAPFLHLTGEAPNVHRLLHGLGVEILTLHLLEAVEPGRAGLAHAYAGTLTERPVDSVVLVTQRLSNDGLLRELEASREALAANGIEAVYGIGDCLAPRLIADCVFDGHRLAREIDSPNPAAPLPFIRERRLVGETTDADYDGQRGRTLARS